MIFLTDEELKELTGYSRFAEQRKQLAEMGIPFKPSRLGRPLVHRTVLAECFGQRTRAANEPDVEALRALQDGKTA